MVFASLAFALALTSDVLPACDPKKHAWMTRLPSAESRVFGVGSGMSAQEALDAARREAAASLSVVIKSATLDRTVAWNDHTDQKIESVNETLVASRLVGCVPADACQQGAMFHRLVQCERQASAEQQIATLVPALAASLPKGARALVLPASDEDGWVTGLGEVAARVLRHGLDGAVKAPTKLQHVEAWRPLALHAMARQLKVTHVLRTELARVGESVRATSWWVALEQQQPVQGSTASVTFPMDADVVALSDLKGPLFPLKHTMDLAALASGTSQIKLRMSKTTLVAGETVSLSFQLPRDGYVYLFNLYEDGRAALLLPNAAVKDHFFRAGVMYEIPDIAWRQKNIVLRACPAIGSQQNREGVKLVYSPSPIALSLEKFESPDVYTLEGGPKGSLSELVTQLNAAQRSGVELQSASASYLVTRKGKSICP